MNGFALLLPSSTRPDATDGAHQRLHLLSLAGQGIGKALLFAEPGCRIVVDAEGTIALIGDAFHAVGNDPVLELSDAACRLLALDTSAACRLFWGNYVLLSTVGDDVRLLRAPFGVLPAYVASADFGLVVASNFALLVAARGRCPPIDPLGLGLELAYSRVRAARTPLVGVVEVLPGESATLGSNFSTEMCWRPPDAHDAAIDVHAAKLHDAIVAVVGAWARRFPDSLLELSGGLDSSVVAVTLKASGARSAAAMLHGYPGDNDESRYAAAAAGVAKLELLSLAPRIEAVRPPGRLDVRPRRHGLLDSYDAALDAIAAGQGASALFTGAGGDAVFGLLHSAGPVLDALFAGGVAAALTAASDIATVTRVSMSTVLAGALRHGLAPRRRPIWRADLRYLAPGAVACDPHPWLDLAFRASPGRRAHIAAIVSMFPLLDAFERGRARPMIAPLMAQPVVEACLAVPTPMLSHGGRDRAVARRAFEQDLPSLIINRRGKGTFAAALAAGFAASAGDFRDILCNGHLVAGGIVDKRTIAAALADPPALSLDAQVRLAELADAELWARAITAGSGKAAA